MFGREIKRLVEKDLLSSQDFRGVFSCDTLPQDVSHLPMLLVANTDTSDLPGSHWVAVWINRHGRGYFFDSYGFPPKMYGQELHQFMNDNTSQYTTQKRQLQAQSSDVCGQWCVYFCYWIVRLGIDGIGLLLQQFTNRKLNDSQMLDFIQTHIGAGRHRVDTHADQRCVCMEQMLRCVQSI